jgi:DNA gyrase subunit A
MRREASVLTVNEGGWGKRIPLSEFPLQKRGGLGTLAVPAGATGGGLVGALEVVAGDEVTLVTAVGRVIGVAAVGIPEQGRRTRGGRIAVPPEGDRVVEVSRSIGEEPERGRR